MQLIAFVAASGRDPELDVYGGEEAGRLAQGDIVWLVTRMPDARGMPGICGRLVVLGTQENRATDRPMELAHAHHGVRIIADRNVSERCDPFPCDVVRTWDVWRSPFGALAEVTPTQAACLETFWLGSEGRRVPRRTV